MPDIDLSWTRDDEPYVTYTVSRRGDGPLLWCRSDFGAHSVTLRQAPAELLESGPPQGVSAPASVLAELVAALV